MKRKTLLISSLMTAGTLALSVGVLSSQHSFSFHKAKAGVTDLEITSAIASTISLSNWSHSGKDYEGGASDRQFRYELGNEKYIDGLLLFNDCGHQSVGATLGDSFVLDNTEQGSYNAFNFNIILAVKGITSARATFVYTATESNWSPLTDSRIKIKYDYTSTPYDLKTVIDNKSYGAVTLTGGYSGHHVTSFSNSTFSTAGTFQSNVSSFGSGINLISFAVDGEVKPGVKLEISLSSLELSYTC